VTYTSSTSITAVSPAESAGTVDITVQTEVGTSVEAFQLPAPDFSAITTMQPGFTKATLFAYRKLSGMDSEDRIRACYQHACLCFVTGRKMTNASLRDRFGIEERNAARASRIIGETLAAGRIKPFDPDQGKKYACYLRYLPFWA
jgi:ATP-dependent DNA helicase RecG